VSGSSEWQQLSNINSLNGFGYSVALSGSTQELVIGGQMHTAASVCLFERHARLPFALSAFAFM
jgi:hypothetical protein